MVIVSREALLTTAHSTVLCAPIYSNHDGIASQVLIGSESGLRGPSSIHCDNVVSVARAALTDFIGALPPERVVALDRALAVALGIDHLIDE
jgi:mRNA interferase MazF